MSSAQGPKQDINIRMMPRMVHMDWSNELRMAGWHGGHPKHLWTSLGPSQAAKIDLSPDLSMVKAYIAWRVTLDHDTIVPDAMAGFGYEQFRKDQERLAKVVASWPDENPSSQVKQELADDWYVEEKKSSSKAKAKAKADNKTIRDKCMGLPFLEKLLLQDAEVQFGRLVVEEVKSKVKEAGEGDQSSDPTTAVESMAILFEGVHDQWVSSVSRPKTTLAAALQAAGTCFACMRVGESNRPTVGAARDARRAINSFAKEKGVCGDLSNAMLTLKMGVEATNASLAHSRAGIEDTNARGILVAAEVALEQKLAPHASSIVDWVKASCGQEPSGFSGLSGIFVEVQRLVMAAMGSLVRFSAVGLEAACGSIVGGLTNCVLVMQAAEFGFLFKLHNALGEQVSKVTNHLAVSDVAEAGDKQLEMEPTVCADQDQGDGALGGAMELGCVASELTALTEAAKSLKMPFAEFGATITDLLKKLVRCMEALHKRASGDETIDLILETSRVALREHCENLETTELCLDYIAGASELLLLDKLGQSLENGTTMQEFHDMLCNFCKTHTERSGGFMLKVTDGFDSADTLDCGTFEAVMAGFTSTVGQQLYDKHCHQKIKQCFERLQKNSVEVSMVNPEVLKDSAPDKKLAFLIRAPALQDLLLDSLSLEGAESDEKAFEGLDHNQALGFLKKFVEIIGVEAVVVPGSSHPDSEVIDGGMPTELALFYGDIACATTDLSIVAAHLHRDLLLVAASGGLVTQVEVHGPIAYELNLFKLTLSRLDKAINCEFCLACEKSSWRLPVSLSSVREWACCMGVLGGDLQTLWLRQVSCVFQAQSSLCAGAVPSWTACFDGEVFLRPVASKLLEGKFNSVVGAHNSLHQLMARLGSAATLLGISPRLQDNAETLQAVRIAFDNMSRASLASVVVLAAELVLKFERDASGSQGARSFLSRYARSAYPTLPEVLWTELEGIAAHVRQPADGERQADRHDTLPASSPWSKAPPPSASSPSASTSAPQASRKRPPSETDSAGASKTSPANIHKRTASATLVFSASKQPRRE